MPAIDIIGKKMTLLGTGGAAASIIAQAALDGVPEIDVIARKGTFLGDDRGAGQSSGSTAGTDCKVCMYELAGSGADEERASRTVPFWSMRLRWA